MLRKEISWESPTPSPFPLQYLKQFHRKQIEVDICTLGRIRIVHIAPDLILYTMNNHLILSLGTHC